MPRGSLPSRRSACLRRARAPDGHALTHVKLSPEDVEEAVRPFDESVVPAAAQEDGFMGALLLTREDGRALVARVRSVSTPPVGAPTSGG